MSELTENPIDEQQETGQGTPVQDDPPTPPTPPASTSIINLAVEAVMNMIDGLNLFATIQRGALGISSGLCCEIAPSVPEAVFLDKNYYIPLTLALNGKHDNLQTLSDAMNKICDSLPRMKSYTDGNGFKIVDITSGNLPRVIGREGNNSWIMACDLVIKIYRKDEET